MIVKVGDVVTDPQGNEWTVKEVLPGEYGFILARMVEIEAHARPDLVGPGARMYRPKVKGETAP